MSNPKISLIAQISDNRVLARNGRVPFVLPTDKKRYMDKLAGKVVIAGRRSYESKVQSKLTIVVSRDPKLTLPYPHMIVVHSLEEALEKARAAIESGSKNQEVREVVNFRHPELDSGSSHLAKIPDQVRNDNTASEIFITGGGEIFAQTIGIAGKLYLTVVHEIIDGEVFFPDYSQFRKTVFREDHVENGHKFTFLDLEKG